MRREACTAIVSRIKVDIRLHLTGPELPVIWVVRNKAGRVHMPSWHTEQPGYHLLTELRHPQNLAESPEQDQ